MTEKPKPDQIKEPRLWGNFSTENATSSLRHLMDNESIKAAIESAGLVADLGSGIGTSTLGLSLVCQNAKEIHSVDASFSNLNEDIKDKIEAKSIHHRTNFHEFLETSIRDGKKFEVILIKSAPEHQLQKK
jgi:hypothetical protein